MKVVNEDGKEKVTKFQYSPIDSYVKQINYFFDQFFEENRNLMNNYSEALKTFKKIMEFKNKEGIIER